MLRALRSSNDKRKWQHAVALLDLHRHCTIASICRKLERSLFLTHGLASLALPSRKAVNQGLITRSTSSSDEAVDLLSPTPARQPNCRQSTLLALFPSIHQSLSDPIISLLDEWKYYKRRHPQGLRYSRFSQLYDPFFGADKSLEAALASWRSAFEAAAERASRRLRHAPGANMGHPLCRLSKSSHAHDDGGHALSLTGSCRQPAPDACLFHRLSVALKISPVSSTRPC